MTDISPINIPADIRQTESVFFQYKNDINIYTEDKDEDREFYEKLFKRLLNGTNIRINNIYPLGNKSNVIKKCKEDKSPNPKIYIVDGDIYLQFKQYPEIENLFRLGAYCIENYVIDQISVESTAYDLTGVKSKQQINAEANYSARMSKLEKPLTELFFMLSIQAELTEKFDIKNVEQFLNRQSELDAAKIQKEISAINSAIIKSGFSQDIINEKMSQRIKKFGYSPSTLLTIVSGKDYLIPYWKKIITRIAGGKLQLRKEAWKFKLVDYCDLSRLTSLKQAIVKTIAQA